MSTWTAFAADRGFDEPHEQTEGDPVPDEADLFAIDLRSVVMIVVADDQPQIERLGSGRRAHRHPAILSGAQ